MSEEEHNSSDSVKKYEAGLDLTFGDDDAKEAEPLLAMEKVEFRGLSFDLSDRINPERALPDAPFTREHSDLISFLKQM